MKKKDHDKIVDDLKRENQGHLRTNTKYYKGKIAELEKALKKKLSKREINKKITNLSERIIGYLAEIERLKGLANHTFCNETIDVQSEALNKKSEVIEGQKTKLDTYYKKVKDLENEKTALSNSVSKRLEEIYELKGSLAEKNTRITDLEQGIVGLIIKLK